MGKPIAEPINHLNYPDGQGQVYCRAKHKVRAWGSLECFKCPLFAGSIQGMGVECVYVYLISQNNDLMTFPVPDPLQQERYIADLISKGLILADPIHESKVRR